MKRSARSESHPADVDALLHSLEVRQAELETQNLELATSNEELRRSNEALAVARERFRLLHNLAPAPLFTVDASGLIIDANSAAEDLLRAPRGHLVDRPLALFVAESARATLRGLLDRLFAVDAPPAAELKLLVEGEPVDVLAEGVFFREDGHAKAVLALVDLTARKRAEQARRDLDHRAQEAQRLESLGVLAGGIAHDFNNLLTVILAGTEHVLRALGDSPLTDALTETRQAAVQAGRLAHQMLAYSGHASQPVRPLELGALIRELEPLIRASAKATPVSLPSSATAHWISGDETQIRQLVLNLVINAAEAMVGRPGGITIGICAGWMATTAVGPPCVVLEVADQGTGMDVATQARIFDPYFSTRFVGRGLGLAVVQGIVRGHGGEITVATEVGRGATFRVFLPEVPPAADARAAAAPAPAARGSGKLLVVDDEPLVQRSTERLLAAMGFEVVTASDGDEAIELLRSGVHIDMVLMDKSMPRMDGVVAAAAIHELRPDLPIVLVSGYGDVPPGADRTFVATLAKPFAAGTLESILEQHLVRPKP
jgi:PAS domain S-box-containing protein